MPNANIRKLRLDLILEELLELGKAFGYTLTELGWEQIEVPTNIVLAADATADLKVVVLGTDCALGLDAEPIFEEVMRSNYTKLVNDVAGRLTCVKNASGKILKSATYVPPNFVPILNHQLNNPLA
jgi:predicted HAD superfamily Cof-like phosphohydrolase